MNHNPVHCMCTTTAPPGDPPGQNEGGGMGEVLCVLVCDVFERVQMLFTSVTIIYLSRLLFIKQH